MSVPSVRYHLRKLLAMGLIYELPNTDSRLKAGRKERLYRRYYPEINQNILLLCSLLIHNLPDLYEENDPAKYLGELVLKKDKEGTNKIHFSIRELVAWLNQWNYQASWEAGKSGPILNFANCPYRDIRSGNEILCQMDRYILNELSDLLWELTGIMDWQTCQGACQFVGKREA
jgi:predicted ArsR family transcriptional regulator